MQPPVAVVKSPPLPTENAVVHSFPVDSIRVNPFQPRRIFDAATLRQLSESIQKHGLIQPIVVARVGDHIELVAGERRLRAAKLAGLAVIPAIERIVDATGQARMALVENIHREDLNPMDRAECYQALLDTIGCTQAELAESIGEERSTISNHLRLLELVVPVRDLVRSGQLSLGHAKVLGGVDAARQINLAQRCGADHWSVRRLESEIARSKSKDAPQQTQIPTSTPYLNDLADRLTRTLGVRAHLKKGATKGSGQLILSYATLDEFDGLLAKLNIDLDNG